MEAAVGIVARLKSWFTRSSSSEPEPGRPRDVPYLPPTSETARPRAGTMAVEPLRRSGFGF
jgi:hypothetical protein